MTDKIKKPGKVTIANGRIEVVGYWTEGTGSCREHALAAMEHAAEILRDAIKFDKDWMALWAQDIDAREQLDMSRDVCGLGHDPEWPEEGYEVLKCPKCQWEGERFLLDEHTDCDGQPVYEGN